MGATVFLFVNATKIYQYKTKESEIKKKYPLCLANISGDFSANNMKKLDQMSVCRIFLLTTRLLTLVILSI